MITVRGLGNRRQIQWLYTAFLCWFWFSWLVDGLVFVGIGGGDKRQHIFVFWFTEPNMCSVFLVVRR